MEDFRETRFEALGAGHFDPNVREEDATEARRKGCGGSSLLCKITGDRRFWSMFYLPGFHFGQRFLTHTTLWH